jgi:hypothetical protein
MFQSGPALRCINAATAVLRQKPHCTERPADRVVPVSERSYGSFERTWRSNVLVKLARFSKSRESRFRSAVVSAVRSITISASRLRAR